MGNSEKSILENQINSLENKAFRLESEIFRWRMFRDEVKKFLEMQTTFGKNTPEEYQKLKKELDQIKYY